MRRGDLWMGPNYPNVNDSVDRIRSSSTIRAQ